MQAITRVCACRASKVEVSDDEVEERSSDLRERSATLKKVEDRTRVEEGDLALAEIEGFDDGKPLSKARRSDSASWKFPPTASPTGWTKC